MYYMMCVNCIIDCLIYVFTYNMMCVNCIIDCLIYECHVVKISFSFPEKKDIENRTMLINEPILIIPIVEIE